jgi:hypothetical protein
MPSTDRPPLIDVQAIVDAGTAPCDEGAHSWGFGAFLRVERDYEGGVPQDDDPDDLRPWCAA